MKVKRIKEAVWVAGLIYENGNVIKGGVYTVIGTIKDVLMPDGRVKDAYRLEEKPVFDPVVNRYTGFDPCNFIPLEYWEAEFNIKEKVDDCIGVDV